MDLLQLTYKEKIKILFNSQKNTISLQYQCNTTKLKHTVPLNEWWWPCDTKYILSESTSIYDNNVWLSFWVRDSFDWTSCRQWDPKAQYQEEYGRYPYRWPAKSNLLWQYLCGQYSSATLSDLLASGHKDIKL